MALVSGRSTLNPDAPFFIPAAYRKVEDFSPEWWQLVTTSTWYRDYWPSQHQDEEGLYDNGEGYDVNDVADLLPDAFDFDAAADDLEVQVQFEDLVESYEAEAKSRSSPLPSNAVYRNGSEFVVEAPRREGLVVGNPKFNA